MEDHAIQALDDIAASYAEIRDERIKLSQEEGSLKDHARRLMKQHSKTIYRHNGIEIRLVPGEEDVKVKVPRKAEDDDAPPAERAEFAADRAAALEGDELDGAGE